MEIARLFFYCRNEVSDRLLILYAHLGEADSLSPMVCPYHCAVRLDVYTGNG